jgi:hypothetical protein
LEERGPTTYRQNIARPTQPGLDFSENITERYTMSRRLGNPKLSEYRHLGTEAIKEKAAKLKEIKPVLQVKDLTHAKSDEVKEYCLRRLQEGATYEVLRRELGLRTASTDHRWRYIRNALCQILLPQSDEEALTLTYGDINYWIMQLEKMVTDIDQEISKCQEVGTYVDPRSGQQKMLESNLLGSLVKTKVEAIRHIIEKRNKYFEDFMDIQRLRKMEKMTRGQSIVIVNNIPRPEQTLKEARTQLVEETKTIAMKLTEGTHAIKEGIERENNQLQHKKASR